MTTPDIRLAFRDLPIAHVGFISPGGAPHVVPLWFVWLEEGLYVSCREGSRVRANLVADPRVVLQFDRGRAWTDQSGVLVHGVAEFLPPDSAAAGRVMSAWFDKYTRDLGGENFAEYAEQVTHPVLFRVRPQRLSVWRHGSPRS